MFELYVSWLKSAPLLTAAIQFAILGTLGDMLAARLRNGKMSGAEILSKLPTWAILGISIKYAFLGGTGATAILMDHGFLPTFGVQGAFFAAFYKSLLVNTFFGPFMMIGHRLSDDYVYRCRYQAGEMLRGLTKANLWSGLQSIHWDSMKVSLGLLLKFWVPAHTLTFLLPEHFQIPVAALWAIALGGMLGYFNRTGKTEEVADVVG